MNLRSSRLLLPFLLLAAVGAATLGLASARAVRAEPAPLVANDAIEEAMGTMNAALKALGKGGITAETRDTALAELAKFETAVIAAKAATPDTAAGVEEKKWPEFVAGYRKTLIEALKHACDAEVAILDGKYKDAETIVRNKLGALKQSGHSKYKKDE